MSRDLLEFILALFAALSLLLATGALAVAWQLWNRRAADAERIRSLEQQNAALFAVINEHFPNELAETMRAQASVTARGG